MGNAATSGVRRAVRRSLTLAVTILIFAGAGAAVFAGLEVLSHEPGGAEAPRAPITSVGVMRVEPLPGYMVTRRFTGQVEAAARIDLGFELGGRVTQVLADEGDRVARGAVLARLDTSALMPERAALEAELAALGAEAELARLTLSRNDALTERGFRSVAAQDDARLALERAEAGMAAVRARIAGVDVELEKSVLTAPFAARIGERLIDPGRAVSAGEPVLVLFEDAPPEVRVGLPPALAAGLEPGGSVKVERAGVVQPAAIRQIRPDLDPSTRSRSVVITLPDRVAPVLGDTVALVLDQSVAEPGFWAPLSALREGARGSWSVMALESTPEGDRTLPAAVEVIHSDGARVFLRGELPPGARIVAEAPDRVAPGQLVLALAE
ncbi:efflux RND transporter periplasmic adaptor subunit [Histidinibacterium lentulum]|uniref:Efflux RND transporter periplasmic adaptor subunit n=1 Tax=Histidinibacterium lentulum TaxID=2480588 RepID=A0A3N2RA59_9RHOB|nr:efflux RND transporter periplasmic adaptor subunit [Histidinibacterium lentulum]ROU04362.1 efflux RND transporter periplasmic adaptor subunit [Histidinibacterium lentulum]